MSFGEARVAPGVVHQHQREQSVHLGLVGHQLGERTAESDRLCREVAATAVALVEDQVDDREHGGDAVGKQVRRRHAERDPGLLDLAFRPDEPLRHRRLGDEKRARDLLCRQPAEAPQRERDLRVERERGVTAREDELEPLVRDGRLVHLVLHRLWHVEQADLLRERPVAPDAIDRAVARRRHEPRTAGSPASLRAASARPRSRTLPARLPRRGRSRRGSRSGWPGRGPIRRGRPARGALTLDDGPDLDRPAHARRRDA